MILFFAYLDSLGSTSTRSLTRSLWISLMESCSNNSGTSWGSVCPSMLTFRQSLKIGYFTTCWWFIVQLYRDFFIWSFIVEFPFRFCFQLPFCSSIFNCLTLRFSSSNSAGWSFIFHIKYVSEKTQWFSSAWFLDWCWWRGIYCTDIGESFRNRNHGSLKNIF